MQSSNLSAFRLPFLFPLSRSLSEAGVGKLLLLSLLKKNYLIEKYMKDNIFAKVIFTCALTSVSLASAAQVTMTIDATRRSALTSDHQYGLFFEEINHAGDGGLYAELIRNRSFEDATTPESWKTITGASMGLVSSGLLNNAQGKALQVQFSNASDKKKAGICNEGFWGMSFKADSTYHLTLWVKANENFKGKIYGQLQTTDGQPASAETVLEGTPQKDQWVKLTATIKATADSKNGRFALLSSANGTAYFDVVSLMPYTWKGRKNGLRPDLAQLLADTKPTFLRFPGGCYVEGQESFDNAFQWKKTIGPIEGRSGHKNVNWGYRSSDGLGYDEYLQMCEDLGADPMFVVSVGMGHGFTVPFEQVDTLIQNTLDAIEYANGDETTRWGRVRVTNGHAAPYNIKFLEVGNENSQGDASYRNEYARRYAKFYDAIKAKYPDMVVIGNVEAWGTDNPLWVQDAPTDMVDEHYYRSAAWMRKNYNKYDRYNRGIAVYNGEYAANASGTYGTYGNLNSALGESIYMLGMEKNSDVCKLASFAPIFTHESDPKWPYDMIHFNASSNFCTPSYYVQKLLGNNLGKQNLRWTETGNVVSATAEATQIGVGAWNTQVRYDNVQVTDGNGATVISDDFSTANADWQAGDGKWSVVNGMLAQTATAENCVNINTHAIKGGHYTYKLRAYKNGGSEGFLVIFNYQDDKNYCWWNIGGWNNKSMGVEQCVNGSKTTLVQTDGTVESNKFYDIEIDVNGADVTCKLNGTVKHQFTLPAEQQLYQAVQLDEEKGMMYLKVTNPNGNDTKLNLNLKNMKAEGGTVIRLTSANGTDENTMDNPFKVVPAAETAVSDITTLDIPAYSLNIFKIKVSDVQPAVSDGITDGDADKYGYLYAHMNANGEFTNYALSRYGNNFKDLCDGAEVFDTKKFTQTGGMRDAYVCRTESGKFILAGTDMTSSLGWESNHIMVLMLSNDLVHWDKTVSIDLASAENLKALGLTRAQLTAAWAPEVIYDPVTKKYMMYYSVGVKGDRHRIYYSLFNEDLTGLTQPKLLFDPGYDVIDADIVYNKLDDQYVMFYKDERNGYKCVYRATAKTLVPEAGSTGACQWKQDSDFIIKESGKAIEGVSAYRPIGSRTWKVAYMLYGGGYAYKLADLDEHCSNPGEAVTMSGEVKPQHGSFLTLTEREYTHLENWNQLLSLVKDAKALNASAAYEPLTKAIEAADKALAESGTFDEEYTAMKNALTGLMKAYGEYKDYIYQQAYAGQLADITFLLQNPDFSQGSTGWKGTSFTAANGQVAEQYNKTFDFYQELSGLPNGRYRLEVQSFYRAGGKTVAAAAHQSGREVINAHLYLNNEEKAVCSLFDAEGYTLTPYTYPDNVTQANAAFNEKNLYHNSVECQVTDGKLKVGIRSTKSINSDWCCFDNFKLTYLDSPAAVKSVTQTGQGAQGVYSLLGVRMSEKPSHGVFIENGKTRIK